MNRTGRRSEGVTALTELMLRKTQKQAIRSILGDTELVAADIGARGDIPEPWLALDGIASVLSFEPDEAACEQLRSIYDARGSGHKYRVVAVGLAGDNAERILQVTHSPGGSSLFDVDTPLVQAYVNQDYLYPIQSKPIRTRNAFEALTELGVTELHLIKLDVQGTELEILRAMRVEILDSSLVVQLEAAFHPRCPDYPVFCDIDAFMRQAGFELWDLEPIRVHRTLRGRRAGYLQDIFRVNVRSPSVAGRVWECDALYCRPPESLVERRDARALRRLAVCYGIYGLFTEAFHTLSVAESSGLVREDEARALKESVLKWHSHSSWLARFTRGAAGRSVERLIQRFRRKMSPIRGALKD